MQNKTKSVVLFGDSHLGRFNRDRSKKLEKAVSDIIVYGCAVGGWTTEDGAKRAGYIAKLNPDFVVLSFPGNDFIDNNDITIEESKNNLKTIIEAFRVSKIILFLGPLADDRFEDEEFNKGLPKYNEAAKAMAKTFEIQIIDGPQIYSKLNEDYHEEDGVHLNEFGYDILIQELAKKIKSFTS